MTAGVVGHYLKVICSRRGMRSLFSAGGMRAARKLALLGGLLAVVLPLQLFIFKPVLRNPQTLPRLMLKAMNRIMGIRVTFNGAAVEKGRPMIYFANHLSYIDMQALAAGIPALFVGGLKAAKVPLSKKFGDSAGIVFVESTKDKKSLARVHEQIATTLNKGYNLIVFPEGISSDGTDVRTFKGGVLTVMFSNLSAVPLEGSVAAQPFVIRVRRVNGQEVGDADRPAIFNWYARWTPESYWTLLQKKSIDVEVTGLPVIEPRDYGSREIFLAEAEKVVRSGLRAPMTTL